VALSKHVQTIISIRGQDRSLTDYVLRRIGHSVVVLAALLTLVFILTQSIGDPALLIAGSEASPELVETIRQNLDLNDPLHERFLAAAGGWLRGDFGESYWRSVPAMPLVLARIPATLYLAAATIVIAVPVALVSGTLAATRPRSILDRSLTTISTIGISTPNFWLGLVLILVVAVRLGWLPSSGIGGLGLSGIPYVILPALTLGVRSMSRIAQMTRSSMLDELAKPYITTAKAKGLSERAYVIGHALKNSSLPILTLAGDEVASIMNGVVIVETVFAWPGLGSLLIESIEQRDLPLVAATVFVVATITILVNLLVDLAYAKLDPRVRLAGAKV
jgi:peptide/nickel transport system permease protein